MLGTELRGKQLGLVGLRANRAGGCRTGLRIRCAGRLHVTPGRPISRSSQLSLDRLLNTSDIVSLHVPLTPETRHLIDKRALTRMKRSAYLINTSRGPVVDEEALAWALEHRLIAGAALDVYEREPVIHPALLPLENVLLVPASGERHG